MLTRYLTHCKINLLAVSGILAALVLVGCGGTSHASSPGSTPTSRSATAATATLKHVPTGMTTIHWDPSSHTLMVKISLVGLAPNSTHAAHIHHGSCASQGPVVYPLQTVMADASGRASETTTIKNVTSIPSSGWYVNLHHSTVLSTQTGFDPIACGDVRAG